MNPNDQQQAKKAQSKPKFGMGALIKVCYNFQLIGFHYLFILIDSQNNLKLHLVILQQCLKFLVLLKEEPNHE